MYTYEGKTIASIYEQMLGDVLSLGVRRNPRGKWTKALHNVCIEMTNSVQNKFLLIPNRNLNYAFAMAEIIWILSGRGDIEYIGFYNKGMARYLDDDKGLIDYKGMTTCHDLHSAYGKRIRRAGYMEAPTYVDFDVRKFRDLDPIEDPALFQSIMFSDRPEIDQLQMVYEKIQADINTRQAVVTLWDVYKDNLVKAKDHTCNTQVMFDVLDGKLNMTVIRRSNDIVWGLPYNIVQFSSIQEYMAGWLGLRIGTHCEFIKNLHIYEDEYTEISDFFIEKIYNNEDFVLNLDPINHIINISGESSKSSKAEMDRLLQYFLESELEWRTRIKPDTHDAVLNLYVERWIGELNLITASDYWKQIYIFMMAYHMYKSKHYEVVMGIIDTGLSPQFKVMAVETMKKIAADIVKTIDFSGLDKGVHKQFKAMYVDLLK